MRKQNCSKKLKKEQDRNISWKQWKTLNWSSKIINDSRWHQNNSHVLQGNTRKCSHKRFPSFVTAEHRVFRSKQKRRHPQTQNFIIFMKKVSLLVILAKRRPIRDAQTVAVGVSAHTKAVTRVGRCWFNITYCMNMVEALDWMQLWKPRGESGGGVWLPCCGSFKIRFPFKEQRDPASETKRGCQGRISFQVKTTYQGARYFWGIVTVVSAGSARAPVELDVTPWDGHKMSLLRRNYACSFIIHEGVPGLRLPGNNNWRVFPASCRSACQIWSSASSRFLFNAKRSGRHSSTHPALSFQQASDKKTTTLLLHPEHD